MTVNKDDWDKSVAHINELAKKGIKAELNIVQFITNEQNCLFSSYIKDGFNCKLVWGFDDDGKPEIMRADIIDVYSETQKILRNISKNPNKPFWESLTVNAKAKSNTKRKDKTFNAEKELRQIKDIKKADAAKIEKELRKKGKSEDEIKEILEQLKNSPMVSFYEDEDGESEIEDKSNRQDSFCETVRALSQIIAGKSEGRKHTRFVVTRIFVDQFLERDKDKSKYDFHVVPSVFAEARGIFAKNADNIGERNIIQHKEQLSSSTTLQASINLDYAECCAQEQKVFDNLVATYILASGRTQTRSNIEYSELLKTVLVDSGRKKVGLDSTLLSKEQKFITSLQQSFNQTYKN